MKSPTDFTRPFGPANPFIATVDDALTAEECAKLIERITALGPSAAPVTTRRGPVMMPSVRNNERVMFDDVALAQTLLERVRHVVPETLEDMTVCGANERLRCYRYAPGQCFRPHFDGSFIRDASERSLLTLIVYLDTCEGGGETRFVDFDFDVQPAPGRALLFNHRVLHEGRPVVAGLKHVVRTDVMYRLAHGTGADRIGT